MILQKQPPLHTPTILGSKKYTSPTVESRCFFYNLASTSWQQNPSQGSLSHWMYWGAWELRAQVAASWPEFFQSALRFEPPQKHLPKTDFLWQVAEMWHPNGGSRDAFVDSSLFVMVDPWCVKHAPSVSNVFLGDFSHPQDLALLRIPQEFRDLQGVENVWCVRVCFFFRTKIRFSFSLGGCFIQISLLFPPILRFNLTCNEWRKRETSPTSNWFWVKIPGHFWGMFFVGRISCASGSSPSSASSFAPTISP